MRGLWALLNNKSKLYHCTLEEKRRFKSFGISLLPSVKLMQILHINVFSNTKFIEKLQMGRMSISLQETHLEMILIFQYHCISYCGIVFCDFGYILFSNKNVFLWPNLDCMYSKALSELVYHAYHYRPDI